MPAYLLHYVEFVKDLQVLKFEDPRLADIYGFEKLPPGRTAKVVSGEESFRDRAVFSMGLLAAIYNALGPDRPLAGKFETHDAAARRTFALLYAKFNQLAVTPFEVITPNLSVPPSHPIEETIDMAKSATTNGVRSSRAPGVGRLISQRPAGLVSEFKQTRQGTDRAQVLKLMDGTKTPDEIAVEMGGGKFDAKYVMAHAYCLHRDCAIGYELTKEGKLLALYPRGRSYGDAIKAPVEKKAPVSRRKTADVEAEPAAAE